MKLCNKNENVHIVVGIICLNRWADIDRFVFVSHIKKNSFYSEQELKMHTMCGQSNGTWHFQVFSKNFETCFILNCNRHYI